MCKECKEIEGKKEKKIREVYLDDLPKYKRAEKEVIDWKKSIGYKVKGIYEDFKFEVEIVDYKAKEQNLYVKYKNKKPFKIKTGDFSKCKLGKLLDKITDQFKVEISARYVDEKRDITIIDREYRKDKNEREWKWYKYHCNKCHYEDWIVEPALIKQKIGCSCCSNYTPVLGKNTI